MKVLFFGRLGESIGREVEMDLPPEGCTVAELRAKLAGDYPAIASPAVRACLDKTIVPESARIASDHEVAFVPPLSGG